MSSSTSSDGAKRMVRAGAWCGLPQPNEGRAGVLSVVVDRATLAPGDEAQVIVRLSNPAAEAACYRLATRHLWVQWVTPDGAPLPHR